MFHDVKALIFDMDGTLIDSMGVWEQIDVEYLARFGFQKPVDLHDEIEGSGFYETAVYFKNRFGISDSVEKIQQDWNDMAEYKYTHEIPLKEGVREFLQSMKKAGKKMGIATSNSRGLTARVLKAHRVEDYFDAIITSDQVEHGKPAPDIYLKAAKELGVSPEECLAFEDICAGITAAKRAGMKAVAVADEASASQWEAKCNLADGHIETFLEFCGINERNQV